MNERSFPTTLLTTDEVAELKDVHRETVLRAIRRGELAAAAFGEQRRKIWLVARPAAEKWQPRKPGRPQKRPKAN